MKLKYEGNSSCIVGDALYSPGAVAEFDPDTAEEVLSSGGWSKVESKPKKTKKTELKSQTETGEES